MTHETEQLARLIDEKHACARQLRDLGQCQLECIATGDFTQLMKILAGKQRLLGVLQGIEQRLDPFRQQSPDERRWASPAAREQCAAMVRQCELLLNEVVTQEKKSEGQLTLQRDEAAVRLQGTHSTSQALGAYLAPSESAAGQLDLISES